MSRPIVGLTSILQKALGRVWAQWAIDLTDALNGITFLTASAVLNFGNTAAQTSADLTVAVVGAAVGDPVALGVPAPPDANACFTAFVSAVDVVTVRFNNYSAGAINPGSGAFAVCVFSR